jgi:3-oxoadipate enol-lactonase
LCPSPMSMASIRLTRSTGRISSLGHSLIGSANTIRAVQGGRPPLYVWEKEMEAIRIPRLILRSDEDEACVKPSLFMKRHIPGSGLAFFPKSGHAINLEEPDIYNRVCLDFLTAVEQGKW